MRVEPGPDARHVVDRNLALLSAVGIPVAARAPDAAYLLARPSPEADAFLAAQPRPFAVFHPGAGRAEKTWGEERFATLARALHARARPALRHLVGTGRRAARRAPRRAAAGRVPPAAARLPRPRARRCRGSALFVGGDTGPLHLADALGAPTLALFGPTDPQRNGPYRDRRGVVANMSSVADEEVLERALAVSR